MCGWFYSSGMPNGPTGDALKFDLQERLYFQLLDGDDCELTYEFLLWLDEQHINVRLHKTPCVNALASTTGRPRLIRRCHCVIEFFDLKDVMAYKLRWC